MPNLLLIRGLPGSGKSFLAQELIKDLNERYEHPNTVLFEADDYFTDLEGNYHYTPTEVKFAHQLCKLNCRKAMVHGLNVIIANTFIQKWEMQDYLNLSIEFNYSLEIQILRNNHGSIHGVPSWKIEEMKKRWEE